METLIALVDEGKLPEGGPPLVVTDKQSGESPAQRYAHGTNQPPVFAAADRLVVLVKLGPLTPYDHVGVKRVMRTNNSFHIDLDLRCYEGPLAAYDPQIALVQLELGSLAPGVYELVVMESRWHFRDPKRPEQATDPVVNELRFPFDVL